jgi:N-acetylneuraminate synthase|tara:strand:+ start:1357 stop:2172 length:816 start_codon:yes stop_codon:yes gene_type:complete
MVKVIAEIGINHNGDLDLCKEMILAAKEAGATSVKFQKRDPDVCVPEHQKSVSRETPWGTMTYLEYKHKIEFGKTEYDEINRYCKEIDIEWFLSIWDINSLHFALLYGNRLVKIPSALATDTELVRRAKNNFDNVIVSVGMCTFKEIADMVKLFDDTKNLILFYAVSAYPAPLDQLNLDTIDLYKNFKYPLGYSSHDIGVYPAAATVLKGVKYIEKHFTTDKTLYGTDQSASMEPDELKELVEQVRLLEQSLGFRFDVLPCEEENRKKLRP